MAGEVKYPDEYLSATSSFCGLQRMAENASHLWVGTRHAYQRVLYDQPVHCPAVKRVVLTFTSAVTQILGRGAESSVQIRNI